MVVDEVDVVVVGAGAVGENVADRASRTGLDVALVEHELVGGECSYWGCIPSKALLRPGAALAAARAVPGVHVTGPEPPDVLGWRDAMASHWDDAGQAGWVQGAGLRLLRGHARLVGERTLELRHADGTTSSVRARRAVVLATGSAAAVPDELALVRPWTSREATSAHEVPRRLAVVGGGVVGVEMATAYADLGAQVTLLVRGDRVLAKAEAFAGQAVLRGLAQAGVRVELGAQVVHAERDERGVHLTVRRRPAEGARSRDGAPALPDEVVDADEVLAAAGRRPATTDVGVQAVGLVPGQPLRVGADLTVQGVDGGWLFAVGDVTGRTATTHQGKYDARVAGDVIAARFGRDEAQRAAEAAAGAWSRWRASADDLGAPQVVFTRPEVAWVGRSAAQAAAAGVRTRVLGYELGDLAGASVTAQGYEGRVEVVVDEDRRVLVGATFVGPGVGEMLHAATVAVVGEVTLDRLAHAVPAYPTLSEVWLRLSEAYGL